MAHLSARPSSLRVLGQVSGTMPSPVGPKHRNLLQKGFVSWDQKALLKVCLESRLFQSVSSQGPHRALADVFLHA